MRVVGIYDRSGPKYHRILLPLYGLQQKYNYNVELTGLLDESKLPGTDIVYFNRMIPVSIEKLKEYKEKYGFKLVCDLDDHWSLGRDHVLYEQYKAFDTTEKIVEFIKLSDYITVTHDRLASEVKELNPRVQIYPNAIPNLNSFSKSFVPGHLDNFNIRKEPSDLPRVFWAGGVTHKNDLLLIKDALKKIDRRRAKLVLAGYVRDNPEWKVMAKIFTTNSSFNTHVIESLDVHQYYKCYSYCDIALAPLVKNTFNSYKSNLKILEAANIAAPIVVSWVHPYLDFPPDIVNYVHTYTNWYSEIKKLIEDKNLREDQGAKLKEYCNTVYNFNVILDERNQLFEFLAGNKGA